MSQSILLTVLGGYLGSGKTTVLNHVLRHSDGRGLAVIVNDFGSINIDASLIESRTDEAINLANGCICCSISGGFTEALEQLSRRDPPPRQVIIEASGIADPLKISHYASLAPYRLDGIVVVADAETVRERAQDKYVGGQVVRQLQAADLIILNKLDLVGAAQRDQVQAWIAERAPAARVVPASFGRIPVSVIAGLHREESRDDAGAPGRAGDDGHDHVHDHGHHDHATEYTSSSITIDRPVSEGEFRAMVAAWPKAVLRAKGIVHLREDPGRRHVFQLVGPRWTLAPDRDWAGERPQTRIVVIGLARQLSGKDVLAPLARAVTAA
jgi:G3E family GTPase